MKTDWTIAENNGKTEILESEALGIEGRKMIRCLRTMNSKDFYTRLAPGMRVDDITLDDLLARK